MTSKKPVFAGLVVDEFDNPVDVAYVGEDPCYVVDDAGFRRHIPSEQVDRQVFDAMTGMIEGHEGLISQETAKMLGQDDIFSIAMIKNQLEQIDQQFETLLQVGLPEEARAYMGMMGFKIRINMHGEVIEINQPAAQGGEDEGE